MDDSCRSDTVANIRLVELLAKPDVVFLAVINLGLKVMVMINSIKLIKQIVTLKQIHLPTESMTWPNCPTLHKH